MAAVNLSVATGLGTSPLPVTNVSEVYQELVKLYNAIRNIIMSYDTQLGLSTLSTEEQTSAGVTRINLGNFPKFYLTAAVDISRGKTVELVNYSSTEARVQLGTDGKVIGFCSSTEDVLAGGLCEVTIWGLFPDVPAGTYTPGSRYYQSGTPGAMGLSGVGTQFLGVALTDTKLLFIPEQP